MSPSLSVHSLTYGTRGDGMDRWGVWIVRGEGIGERIGRVRVGSVWARVGTGEGWCG